MVTFVLAGILIVLATLAVLIWPLLFTRNTFSYARHAQNIHYAKERLAELEDQLKNATISATDYEALKLEIETTLAEDIDLANNEQSESSPLPRRPNKAAIASLCVFVPIAAIAFYYMVGTPAALSPERNARPSSQAQNNQPSAKEINAMMANLEEHLVNNPNDLKGWQLMARTSLALGQYGKAGNALRRVLELEGESAANYASLADATALANNGNMQGEPTQFADKALELNPGNRQALWLRGLAAVQNGENTVAEQYWGRLLGILSDQPQQQAQLKVIMAESLGKEAVEKLASASTASETTSRQAPESDAGITVTINVSSDLFAKLEADDPVFVFARAKEGPPAPLAAKRLSVADLPATITLSDQDAMMPQLKLSSFEDVVINARISKSGQPIAQAGDFQSTPVEAKPKQPTKIELLISEVVE